MAARSRRDSRCAVACRALVATGRPRQRALVAATRKLLAAVNAIAKTNTPWREQPLAVAA